ncbi:MAG: hypothetical protein JO031_02465 [Ktedonobacteraceae bacterium]|nr:hypothetical protein [Ktedonobacteraceae bacterium]
MRQIAPESGINPLPLTFTIVIKVVLALKEWLCCDMKDAAAMDSIPY